MKRRGPGGPTYSLSYISPHGDRAARVVCTQVGGQGGRTGKLRITVGLRKGTEESRRDGGGTECQWARVREREDEVNSESVSSSE